MYNNECFNYLVLYTKISQLKKKNLKKTNKPAQIHLGIAKNKNERKEK